MYEQNETGKSGSGANVAYGSRYASRTNLGFHAFRERMALDPKEQERMLVVGQLSADVLLKANNFIATIMGQSDQEWEWLRRIMLGSIPAEYHGFARELMAATHGRRPIQFFRADILGDGRIAELQCPGSGWAYNLPLEEHYGIALPDSPVLRTFRDWANGETMSWWLHDTGHVRSVRHLVEGCREIGVNIELAETEAERDPDRVTALIKRPPLPEFIADEKGRKILKRWLKGEVRLDLLPTMVPETKHLMALLFHPATRSLFTDEERGLCPPTIFVDSWDAKVTSDRGHETTLATAVERHWPMILKYGGAGKELRGGCHGVHSLAAKAIGMKERQELVARAIADYPQGEAWVIQQFVNEQRKVPEMNGRRFVLFRAHYYVDNSGTVRLVENVFTCRADWKVHARSDAWCGLC